MWYQFVDHLNTFDHKPSVWFLLDNLLYITHWRKSMTDNIMPDWCAKNYQLFRNRCHIIYVPVHFSVPLAHYSIIYFHIYFRSYRKKVLQLYRDHQGSTGVRSGNIGMEGVGLKLDSVTKNVFEWYKYYRSIADISWFIYVFIHSY